MPRKSAASLAVVPLPAPATAQRLAPPDDLPPEQAAIWRNVVDAMPADFFGREQVAVLRAYCLHTAVAQTLAGRLAAMDPGADAATWVKLSAQQVAHSKAALAHGRALRVTLNSRTQPDTVGRAVAREAAQLRRPWE